jgi:hypothetical protein
MTNTWSILNYATLVTSPLATGTTPMLMRWFLLVAAAIVGFHFEWWGPRVATALAVIGVVGWFVQRAQDTVSQVAWCAAVQDADPARTQRIESATSIQGAERACPSCAKPTAACSTRVKTCRAAAR